MKAFFVFSGQGAQTVGMGKDLAEAFPEAKALFDEADYLITDFGNFAAVYPRYWAE